MILRFTKVSSESQAKQSQRHVDDQTNPSMHATWTLRQRGVLRCYHTSLSLFFGRILQEPCGSTRHPTAVKMHATSSTSAQHVRSNLDHSLKTVIVANGLGDSSIVSCKRTWCRPPQARLQPWNSASLSGKHGLSVQVAWKTQRKRVS
jgi:hypothetical protein